MQDKMQPASMQVITSTYTGETAIIFSMPDDTGMVYEFLGPEDIGKMIVTLQEAKSLWEFLINHRQERDSQAAINDIETNILCKGGNDEISPSNPEAV